ncbi:MAG: RDD family protein [Blastocatellia bacterium]
MKCESCGNELTGGAIICRVCNYNNALRGDWRSQRTGQRPATRRSGETQPNQSRTTAPMTELPKIVPRKDADANLVRFPPPSKQPESKRAEAPRPAPKPQIATADETGTEPYPPWRAELKERVRQIREKRNTGDLVAPPPAPAGLERVDLDRNPIVESALNRIRWSSPPPATTTAISATTPVARAAAAKLAQPVTEIERQREGEAERRREGETEGRRVIPSVPPPPHPAVSPSLRPEPRLEARGVPRVASPRPNQAGQPVIRPEIGREANRTGNQPTAPATDKPGTPLKPRTASQSAKQIVNNADDQANNPAATRPIVNRVETKTLTPKTYGEAGARPEPKPVSAPGSKILTPRVKPHAAAAEPKVESRSERPGPEASPQPAPGRPSTGKPLTGAPDKHVETQVIEIAQAPEPLPPPEAEPASLWARTMAGACDFEIVATAYLPIFGAYAVLNESPGAESPSSFINESSFVIMLLLLSAITFIYQMVTLIFAGRTFGMALLNLNLVNTDDESMPVMYRQKILRALMATVVFVCFPLYLFARLSLSRRSLPDLISGTTVADQ